MKTICLSEIIWYTIIYLLEYVLCYAGPPPCSSDIYCYGPLLDAVQKLKIYPDSKTFVDMKMKYPPEKIKSAFDSFTQAFPKPNRKQMKQFVERHFDPPGSEFEDWRPRDWKPSPRFLKRIYDPDLRSWASKLNIIWNDLGRKIRNDVTKNKHLYSLIWVPNPTIVPGGRFREFYYWDSYWIIKGLLLCEMEVTTKGMLENFLYMVDHYGLVPNGGRVYYLGRSQPPMLIPMIKLYFDYTRDLAFVANNIDIMEKEFNYWMTNHTRDVTVNGETYTLAVYGDYTSGPRPESYREDLDSAKAFTSEEEKDEFYSELKAAAESGWDFSSRWFINGPSNMGNLSHTKTRSILPVDLNAILFWNARIIGDFYWTLANPTKAKEYTDIASRWLKAVTAVMWHDDVGVWLDYDLVNNARRNYFTPTNTFPLWTECFEHVSKTKVVHSVVRYLRRMSVLYPGGVPTTFQHTGEQWDMPNAWPPLQHVMVMGLDHTGYKEAQDLAHDIAWAWIDSNFEIYSQRHVMFEKYDASQFGAGGSGGEYEVQLGFGWSNAVIMDLLFRYGPHTTSGSDKLCVFKFISVGGFSSGVVTFLIILKTICVEMKYL